MKDLSRTAISVLDLAKYSEGQSIADAYRATRELAQSAERWGYTRYWLAEHHNLQGIASAATPLLIGYVAENTKTIRVGSGGIMLPNHPPLIVAEQFGTLATLYPGRIDLGLGRAPGTDPWTMRALRRDLPRREDDFAELIQELLGFFAAAEPGQKIQAIPGAGIEVPIYILGSSLYSARLAAALGRPYAFAGHFAPGEMRRAFDLYRSEFQPSAALPEPYLIAGIPVVAADSDERATFLATSIQQTFLGLIRNDRRLSPPPVADIDAVWTPQEKAAVQTMLGLLVVGSPKTVRHKIDAFIAETGVDELIMTSDLFSTKDRLRSYELIAQAKGHP